MGYLLGHKARHTVIAGPPPVIIIGTTAHLTPYISGLVADAAGADPVIVEVDIVGHTRQKYHGGPTVGVNTYKRSVDKAKPNSNGITLPGKNAYIEVWTSDVNPTIIRTVTFTFTGPFYLLRGWVKAHVATGAHFSLRSPGGKPYTMAHA